MAGALLDALPTLRVLTRVCAAAGVATGCVIALPSTVGPMIYDVSTGDPVVGLGVTVLGIAGVVLAADAGLRGAIRAIGPCLRSALVRYWRYGQWSVPPRPIGRVTMRGAPVLPISPLSVNERPMQFVPPNSPERCSMYRPLTLKQLLAGKTLSLRDDPRDPPRIPRRKLILADSSGSPSLLTTPPQLAMPIVIDHFRDLVGIAPLREALEEFHARVIVERRRLGPRAKVSAPHVVFTGNPGTGKTEVAKRMGMALKDTGLLEKGHVVAVSRGQLVGSHIGETAILVNQAVDRAMGGVLFVDEAYSLCPDRGATAFIVLPAAKDAKNDEMIPLPAMPMQLEAIADSGRILSTSVEYRKGDQRRRLSPQSHPKTMLSGLLRMFGKVE